MIPKYYRYRVWDDRPYGVPQLRSRDCLNVIFNNNGGKWCDYIRATKGFFFSERLALRILERSVVDVSDMIRCQPEHPIPLNAGNPFPGYWYLSLDYLWDASISRYLWLEQDEEVDRWQVGVLPPPTKLGTMHNSRTGARGPRYCTIELLLIARELKASNFHFTPLDLPDHPDVFVPPFKIDYLGKHWPPQWYPEGFEPDPNNLTTELPSDPLKAK